ncbi:MAG: pyruvate kinase [Actinobacteria bacterium]|nr:pyruvate kinase [Thermoleophilia bacterium]MCB9010341.1 pyruvate kinase [Actinomycetota bacterium]
MASTTRRTKILATLGPASDSEATIRGMIAAGMDAVRLNLSHGTIDEALATHRRVRKIAKEMGAPIGTLVDLPGPKIRAGSFGRDGVLLEGGARVRLAPGNEASNTEIIHVDYADLLTDLEVGDRISLGDGGIDLEVVDAHPDHLVAQIGHGGRMSGRPGVHVPSERLRIGTPTRQDLQILDAFIEADVDMVALSFVRSAHDVRRLGTEPHPRGPLVVAKIETRSAVDNLSGILDAAGAIMIARGDLGIECPIDELPLLQKHIIRECIAHGRPAITATQMLESMVSSPTPTRAEVSDVANAVFDGSSVVMLSGETAVGNDPVNVIATMARVCERADVNFDGDTWARAVTRLHVADPEAVDGRNRRITDSLTNAAWRVAREINANAIICLTRTGFTVRAIARYRPDTPIFGFSPDERVRRQLSVSWGAHPMELSAFSGNGDKVREALDCARGDGHIRTGDIVVVLAGVDGRSRTTEVLRVIQVT